MSVKGYGATGVVGALILGGYKRLATWAGFGK
jgi:hypothetical protein